MNIRLQIISLISNLLVNFFPHGKKKFVFGFVFTIAVYFSTTYAGISVSPKYIFLDSTHKSVTLNVGNPSNEENEVWVEIKFGYVASDDSGRMYMFMDSSAVDGQSAATWLQPYPRRFILSPNENQTVRIIATPPANMPDGEYWARILVSNKPRKVIAPLGSKTASRTGMNIITQTNLAFHYRVGQVNTGLEISDFTTSIADTLMLVSMKLTKIGNASYWGTRTLHLIDQNGKTIFKSSKNTAVYKTLTVTDKIPKRGVSPGIYTLMVEYVTKNRSDVRDIELVQASPIRSSFSIAIP